MQLPLIISSVVVLGLVSLVLVVEGRVGEPTGEPRPDQADTPDQEDSVDRRTA